MLTDRYDLPLSTTSAVARDAYVEGCATKLTMYPGAIEAFDRAIAADPGFALAHTAKAHALIEHGQAVAAREEMAAAKTCTGLTPREASHVAFFSHIVASDSEAALAALPAHLNAWPRDVMVLASTAFTNGLIGSSGRPGQKRMLLDLLNRLAPSYGEDDWWFTAHHGMALSENGERAAARPKIERSFAQNPANPWAAHATAHLAYEEGDPAAACAQLASFLAVYPRAGALHSHLSWHQAVAHLAAGDVAAASRLFREAFGPDVHTGPPRGKLNDVVSFLWRSELAGQPRDAAAWRTMHDFAGQAYPRAGAAFSDMHASLAFIVAGDAAALEARVQQIEELVRAGRYPSSNLVPAAARGFAAYEAGDLAAAIDALEPIAGELERIGGSHAQLDLVRFTLLQAYLMAERADDARRLLQERRHSRAKESVPRGEAL